MVVVPWLANCALAKVRAAQVRLPLAAIALANWLVEQSVGLAASAVAVLALPVSAPVTFPTTLPVTLPVRLPVTLPVRAEVMVVAAKLPLPSLRTSVVAVAVDTAA